MSNYGNVIIIQTPSMVNTWMPSQELYHHSIHEKRKGKIIILNCVPRVIHKVSMEVQDMFKLELICAMNISYLSNVMTLSYNQCVKGI